MRNEQTAVFNAAWRNARARGRGWRARAAEGKKALLAIAPDLDLPALWAA